MLTKQDVASLKDIFPTRGEFDKKLDTIMEKLDALVGEIRDRRDEQTLHQNLHDGIDDRLARHHHRLTKLEAHAQLPVSTDD